MLVVTSDTNMAASIAEVTSLEPMDWLFVEGTSFMLIAYRVTS